MKNVIIVFLILFSACITKAQIDTLWTKTYGGQYMDMARQVDLAADGGFIIVGESENFGPGPWAIHTIKTDAAGNTVWAKDYGGEGMDFPYGVQTINGGYIIGGYTTSFQPSGANLWVVKIDANGDTVWTSVVPNSNTNVTYVTSCIRQTDDGGYLTAGSGFIAPNFQQIQLYKLNADGSFAWKKEFGGSQDDYGVSIYPAGDGNFILSGYTYSFGHVNNKCDGYVIKINSSGDTLWTHTYGGDNYDSFYSIRKTSDGGYVAVGTTQSYGNAEQAWVVKTDALGNEIWSKAIGGSENEAFQGVCETASHGFILSGTTNSSGAGGHDAYFVEIDAQGNILNQQTLGTAGEDFGATIEKINDNDYIAAGSKTVSDYNDFWLIKLRLQPTTPVELTSFTAKTSGETVTLNWNTATETNNKGFEIERNTGGILKTIAFISGKGTTADKQSYTYTDNNLAAGKYTYRLRQIDFDGRYEYSNEVEVEIMPSAYSLEQNYPNPFNPSTTINFNLTVDSKVTLKVYNSLGEEAAFLINGSMLAGNQSVNFNAAGLPSGIYMYKIDVEGIDGSKFTSVKKMMLIK